MRYKATALLILYLAFSFIASAQDDLRGDTIDIGLNKLSFDFSNFNNHILEGDAVIGIKAKMNGVQGIRLDLLQLTVDSVKINAVTSSFSYNDTVVSLAFSGALNTNDSATLEIFYHGHPLQPSGDFGGFYWNGPYAFNIGVSFLADPPNYGKVWFPCFDNFTVRSYYEYYITTQNTKKAFCNGLLEDSTSSGSNIIWHWKLRESIPSYLASVSVADYQTLYDTVQGITGTIPIQLAARATDTTAMKDLFVHLHNAFHIHEGHWGYYRWERVGYCIVLFSSGAMEHATNISFMQLYLNVLSSSCETAMAHELSHHWFGDLVTCNSASEMWLNEGWASYNEALFQQSMYGDSAYRRWILDNHEFVLHQAHIKDGAYLPVSGVPLKDTYGTTVYKKGEDMIHTLRYYMGDSLFFHCLKNYLTDFSYKTATTLQLRDYLSQCSGIDLTDYFAGWILAPGFPHFSIERTNTQPSGNGFVTEMVIRQRLNHAPAYYNNVPVVVSYFDANGNRVDEKVNVSGECTSHRSSLLSSEPVYIALDFDNNLQDAITDEWRTIATNDSIAFPDEGMGLKPVVTGGTNLFRVEHSWIRPEPMQNKIPGLHLHDKRYWTVDGVWQPGFNANAQIGYNGTDPSLDQTFITNSEDSIVVMYRANADSEWAMADSFAINTQGNATNKTGYATIYGVKKGQYAFAIWNSAIADTTVPDGPCEFSTVGVNGLQRPNKFIVFPNPTNQSVNVQFEANEFVKAELFDQLGKNMQQQIISTQQTSVELNLNNIAAGYYLVTLTDKTGNKTSKKLIKE